MNTMFENNFQYIDAPEGDVLALLEEVKGHPKVATLLRQLKALDNIAKNTKGRARLFTDWAPLSFAFSIWRGDTFIMNGGIIFHGHHDGYGDGGAPTFSVSLSPVDGWTMHT